MTAPDAIWRLGEERAVARATKDFALADRLRDEIANAGWDVIDIGGEFEFHRRIRYLLAETDKQIKPIFDGSKIAIAMIVSGFHEDAVATVKSIRAYCDAPIVIITFDAVELLEGVIDEATQVIKVVVDAGWGQAANALLQNVQSEYVVLMDPSTLFTGDAITPVLAELGKGGAVLSILKMTGAPSMIRAPGRSMSSLVIFLPSIGKRRWKLAASTRAQFITATPISSSH
jgi:hypothetical protein